MAVAALLALPLQALAQTTHVSNLGQSPYTSFSLQTDRSQSFKTGSNATGYTLGAVWIESRGTVSFNAAIWETDSDGAPSTLLHTLTAPTTFASGTLVFTAPAAATLAKDTTYGVRIIVASGTTVSLGRTTSDGEDAGGSGGWEIGDVYHFWNATTNAWALAGSAQSLGIAILSAEGTVDTTPPALATGHLVALTGNAITVEFDEALEGDAALVPPPSAFTVKADGVTIPVTAVTPGGFVSASQLVLALGQIIAQGQTATVSYTDPTAGNDTIALQDEAGNDVATFTDLALINRSTVDLTPPALATGHLVALTGNAITVEFDEALEGDAALVPPPSAFTVKADGVTIPVTAVTPGGFVSASQLVLALGQIIAQGQTATVSYTDPTAGNDTIALQDEAGNDVATFTDLALINRSTVSTDATLSALILKNAADDRAFALSPTFVTGQKNYIAAVAYGVMSITLDPTKSDNDATVAYLDHLNMALADADTNKAGFQVTLATGANTIKVKVTAEAGAAYTDTYTVVVTREASAPTVTISADKTSAVFKVDDITYTLTHSGLTTAAVPVTVTLTQTKDFLLAADRTQSVTIPAGQSAATFTVAAASFQLFAAGTLVEDGTLTATVQDGTGYDLGTPASVGVAIVIGVTIRIDQASYSVSEAANLTVKAIARTRPGAPKPTSNSSGMEFDFTDGTAIENTDFYSIDGTGVDFFPSQYSLQGDGVWQAEDTFGISVPDDDLDEDDETFTLTLEHAGADRVSHTPLVDTSGNSCGTKCEVTVTITDDDTAGVTVSESALTVTEENATGDTYTVVLDSQPTASVTVTVEGLGSSDVTANPASLTFTTGNWATAQTVTVTAGDDADLTDDMVSLTHSAMSSDSAYQGITIAGLTVTVNDNDTAQVMGVMIDPGNAQLVVEWTAVDNATGYQVQWKSGGQGYNTSGRQATISSGSTTSHTISSLNNGTEYTVRMRATRTGANNGAYSAEVLETPVMPTAAGVTVSESALTVTEQDTTGDSYTVVLDRLPTASVTVTVGGLGSSDVTANPATLTFTTGNWATAQTVTVTAGDDADLTDDMVSLTHSAMSSDSAYQGITIAGLTVTVNDNDTAQVMGVMIDPGNAQLVVEWTAVDNATGYQVQWKSGGQGYNTSGRQATISSGSTTSHTISSLNNGTEYTVRMRATRTGANNGAYSAEVLETPVMPTAAGVTVSESALTVTEQDTTGDSYTVVLDRLPTASVTVTVGGLGSSDVTANPATLTFTTGNWATAQTVTVTAGDDADLTDDMVSLTHSAMSSDSAYQGITIAGLTVTVNDNDTAQVMGVMIDPGNAQLVVEWTAVDNATGYQVQWKSGGQGYNTSGRQATISSGSTTSHTISSLNNGTEYTVRMRATRTGANNGAYSAEVLETPVMPTAAGVTVSESALTVTEQDTTGDSYTVVLDRLPTASVTVTVGGLGSSDVTANPASLTFTTGSWATAQTVTVTAGNDADTTNDTVSLTHSAMSSDSAYQGITIAGLTVTVNDNDTAQVLGVMIEPGNAQLVVQWTAVANATGYEVQWKSGGQGYNNTSRRAVIGSGSTTSHTISSLNNGTAYTVRVRATRTGANSGAYSAEVVKTPVMPTAAGVTVSESALTVTEEDSTGDSYTVVLDTQPTADVMVTVMGHAGTDVTLTPSSGVLTFTTGNWGTARTVTVTAGDDADTTNDMVTLTHAAASTDSNYSGITVASVVVTVEDNDTLTPPCDGVWCATLTVKALDGGNHFGCANSQGGKACSNSTILTDDEFTHASTDYDVASVQVRSNGQLRLWVNPDLATGSESLVLHVGSQTFAFQAADTEGANYRYWNNSGLSWSAGEAVALKLTEAVAAEVILPAPRLPAVDDPNAIWMATLTVANLGSNQYGYKGSQGGGLTDTAFTYLGDDTPLSGGTYREVGTLYTIDELTYHTSTGQLLFSLDGQFVGGSAANIFVDVGGTQRSFSQGTYSSLLHTYTFTFPNPSWSAGDEVTVKIVVLEEANGPEDLAATSAESGDGFDVALTWAAPTSGGTVTGYRVEYQPDPALQWRTLESSQSGTTYTDSGLGRGTVRYYRVAALRAGVASYSEIVRVQAEPETTEVPEKVNFVDVKPAAGSNRALEVAWNRPRTPLSRAPATGYHVQYAQHDGAAPAVRAGEDWADVTFPRWMEGLPWRTWSGVVEAIEFEESTEHSASLKTVVTGLKSGTKYRVRVRGCTEAGCGDWSYPRQWTTSGTTLNATEGQPLTATLEDFPVNHDGSSAFIFRLAFSAEVVISRQDMKEHALTVVGGTVTRARRVDRRKDLWELTVEPAGTGAVSVLVPLERACTETGALCTADGQALTTGLGHSVPGPAPVAQGQQALTPLAAAFVSVPGEHDGETAFWLELSFDAAVAQGSKRHIRALLGVSVGSVTRLLRKDDRLDHWRVRVEPSSHEAVTVTLSPSPPCGATGAVCTEDGRTFTTALATQIQGPPGLAVADVEVEEAANATLAFAVTLSRPPSSTVTVGYATSDGTATAGSDYTSTSGRLTFAAGETEKTVSVPVLDDAHDEGSETLTLTLSNASGAHIADGSATGTINNTDHMPQAWLARFGRTVGSQVVDALGQRLDGATASHVTVGGIPLTGAPGAVPEAESDDPFGLPDWATRAQREASVQSLTANDLLLGSAFHLSSGGGQGAGAAYTAWGRVATSGFAAEVDDVTMDGDVTSGLVGFDAEWARILAGVMFSHSTGEGDYGPSAESGARAGRVESSLTGVYPYARVALNARVSAWALAGAANGELTLKQEGDVPMPAGITMRMGAVGFKGRVLDGTGASGVGLDVKTDALWVGTKSEDTGELAPTEGDVTRLRVTLEGERAFAAGEGATLTPSAEVGLRHDGGDAETGTGLEVGAGLSYVAGALTVEGQVRTLVAHEDSGYEEWGVSGAVRIAPSASGRGLMLRFAPQWGRTASATERLWSAPDASALGGGGEFEGDARLALDAGYGVGLGHGRGVLTPYAGLVLGDAGSRTVRTGVRWQVGAAVALGLEGTRQTSATGEAGNELMLRLALRF